MFKKLSYLASVSVLASVVMSPAHAVFENELAEEIQQFLMRKKTPQAPVQNQEDQSSFIKTIGTGICTGLYNGAGVARDWLASSDVDPLLDEAKEFGISQTKTADTTWAWVGAALSYVPAKPLAAGVLAATRTLTSYGISEETVDSEDTLTKAIRKFWKEKDYRLKPVEAFTSTACAILMQPNLRIADKRAIYQDFATAWNKGVRNTGLSAGEKDECLLKGTLRFFARSAMKPTETNISVLDIKKNKLPKIAKITADTLFPDPNVRANKTEVELKEAVSTARDKKFEKYIAKIYAKELIDVSFDADLAPRLALLKELETKAIETAPAPVVHALAQSLLIDQESKENALEPQEAYPALMTNELGQFLIALAPKEEKKIVNVDKQEDANADMEQVD